MKCKLGVLMANPENNSGYLEEILIEEASDSATALDDAKQPSRIKGAVLFPAPFTTDETLHPTDSKQFESWTRTLINLADLVEERKEARGEETNAA